MWVYEKKLEYPVRIKTCNPKMAKYIITQYGGPDIMFLYVLFVKSKFYPDGIILLNINFFHKLV